MFNTGNTHMFNTNNKHNRMQYNDLIDYVLIDLGIAFVVHTNNNLNVASKFRHDPNCLCNAIHKANALIFWFCSKLDIKNANASRNKTYKIQTICNKKPKNYNKY